ncbi:DUF6266 family protein [Pedobacter sp. PWIIR3]
MAKLKKGILGPVSGKIGAVVGSTWKGISYIKDKPKLKPKHKRTVSQGRIDAQHKLVYITRFQTPFIPYVTVGYAQLAVFKTEMNAHCKNNYRTAFTGVYPELAVDYEQLKISEGTLHMVKNIQVSILTLGSLQVTWDKNAVRGTSYDDQLMMVLYSPELHETEGCIGGARRAAEKLNFSVDEDFVGQLVHVYFSMTSVNRKKVAESVYWGTLQL